MNNKNALHSISPPSVSLLLFGGKGGVGKTTCATSSALVLADDFPEKKFLLISTDPAHSLLDSLADDYVPGNLTVEEFNASASLNEFKTRHRDMFVKIAMRGTFLDREDITQYLDFSLPGLDELMALLIINAKLRENEYDTIIVDTAPTGHTIKLLSMHQLLTRWLHAIDALLGKHRYMKQVFHGSYTADDVDHFLLDLQHQLEALKCRMTNHNETRFITVTLAEYFPIEETRYLIEELKHLRIPCFDILVNRYHYDASCSLCQRFHQKQIESLIGLDEHFSDNKIWLVPLKKKEVRGVQELSKLWDTIIPFKIQSNDAMLNRHSEYKSSGHYPRVEFPNQRISSKVKLVMLAGKGGVGKTTIASAMALRLAEDYPNRKVLLFSADPAHSLSVCLNKKIGNTVTKVTNNMYGIEINGAQEFNELKNDYACDIKKLLDNTSENLDFSFDREVMTRLMDLSPPGIDEIMAIIRINYFLQKGGFDLLILDSPPSGHFLRILEMPNMIDQWLKLFFNTFLKYKHIFNLPSVVKKMVEMSKQLKEFIRLLQDNGKTNLIAVTAPTAMSFSETDDLIFRCKNLKIPVQSIVFNHLTPKSQCSVCQGHSYEEEKKLKVFTNANQTLPQTFVFRGTAPYGLNALLQLGNSLFTCNENRKEFITQ